MARLGVPQQTAGRVRPGAALREADRSGPTRTAPRPAGGVNRSAAPTRPARASAPQGSLQPTPPVRVIFVQGAAERAGAESVLLGRVMRLPDHGVTPTVAFMSHGPFVHELASLGIDVHVVADTPARMRQPWAIPAQVRALAQLARDRSAHVMEGCGEKMSIWAGWASRIAGCGSVHQLHDAALRSMSSSLVQLTMAATPHDAVVTPSRWMAADFARRLHVRSLVVPNGLMLDNLPSPAAQMRRDFGWPDDAQVITIAGRLQSWKGQDVFLRAAARIADAVPQARFLVIGGALYGWDEQYARRLPRLAAQLGIAGRTAFTGHRDDALALMGASDIVCHCSTMPEPFGMVLIEAMAMGVPVVATEGGGPSEIIDDGRTGVLVAPGDVDEITRAVVGLLRDPGRRALIADNARQAARSRFSADRMARSMAEVYRSVARLPRSAIGDEEVPAQRRSD